MSEGPKEELQFDTAESPDAGPANVSCVACKAPLSSYFLMNKTVFCGDCTQGVLTARGASHVGSFLRAAMLGALAGLAGSGLYYAVAAITGYQLGLVAIVVGLMVGFAVRKGAGGRGGWRYQALAMAISYLAICSSYLPMVYAAVAHSHAEQAEARASALKATQPTSAISDSASTAGVGSASPAAAETASTSNPSNPLSGVVAVVFLIGIALALPFLTFKDVMGLIIIAIALYEAWKVNKAPPFEVSGPFAVGATRDA
jgi:hypothetical protein